MGQVIPEVCVLLGASALTALSTEPDATRVILCELLFGLHFTLGTRKGVEGERGRLGEFFPWTF